MVADGRTVPGEHPFHDPADLTHRTMSGVPVLGMLDRHAKQSVQRIRQAARSIKKFLAEKPEPNTNVIPLSERASR